MLPVAPRNEMVPIPDVSVVALPDRLTVLATVAVPEAPVNTGVSPSAIILGEFATVTSELPALAPPEPNKQNNPHMATEIALPLYLIILNPVS
jgi:hypothetical protein